jgi:hypothetical protein
MLTRSMEEANESPIYPAIEVLMYLVWVDRCKEGTRPTVSGFVPYQSFHMGQGVGFCCTQGDRLAML